MQSLLMVPSNKMINRSRSRESINFSGSLVDPEKDEDLKRTKTDIENNITKILKLIKSEDQSKKNRNPKHSRKETELVGLIEDLNKQYQSLYALCDHLNGDFGKVVSRRRNKRGTASTSDSDSEYFSSEETENNNKSSEEKHHKNAISNTDEVLNKTEAKEFEEHLNSQMKEMEILSQQKRNLELQVESHAREVEELSANNTGLHDRVLELELLLKEEKGVVSILEAKLTNNENQAKSNIAELMAQVNNLDQEARSLRTKKGEMEEKIKGDKAEALTQRKDLMDQLNAMQQNFDSLCNQNKELEAQMGREREQVSQNLIQIEKLKESLAEASSVKQTMAEEKERFLARIKDLELELEAQSNQRNELEEQLRDKSYDMKQLVDENKALQDRNNELKKAMAQRGEEITALMREPESQKNGASMEAMALKAELNVLRLELDTLHEQKSKLDLQNERSQKEYEERLEKMENLKAKLASQIADHEKTVKEQAATIDRINAEHKQTKILSNKFKLNRQTAERKMEELAEEFRRKMEDNIRILHQRIHVAEQLNNENKNSFKVANQRYEEENKMLGEKIASYEEELRMPKVSVAVPSALCGDQNGLVLDTLNELELVALNGLDLIVGKFEEHKEYVLSRVSKMMCEVQFAKDWIKKSSGKEDGEIAKEVEKLKDNVECLKALLNSKEEQEFLLREKVWKLEAKVSKEGGEKLNLTKTVSQLEKKVGKLEKSLKEKDEDLVSLGEKKREAIRQLCFVVDFHRDRCKYLKDLVTKMGANKRK